MDQPDIAAASHHAALRGLARINAVSRSAAILWPAVRQAARRAAPRPARVLDVACGGGDVTIALARRAARAGAAVHLEGCDRSETALAHAAGLARRRGANIHPHRLDVLHDPLPGRWDLIVCSLFLHHLTDAAVVELLRKMSAASDALAVNDLIRSGMGLAAARVGTRLLTRSAVVHVDGPRSVRAAFTRQEMRELARRAGLEGARVHRRWPFRMLVSWRRS